MSKSTLASAIIVLAVLLSAPQASAFNLGVSVPSLSGPNPASIAVADLDGDGCLDVVTANNGASSVSVLRGNGAGILSPKTDFTVGSHPYAVAIGDLNGDGKPDLVTANNVSGNVTVLRNNGSGGFLAKTDFAAGPGPFGVVTADFNLDGMLDVAVVNNGSSTISVFLGDGLGGLTLRTTLSTGANPVAIAAGDVSGDGFADLVTANSAAGTVSVFVATGSGYFLAKHDFTAGAAPFAVTLGDINNDLKLDIAAANLTGNSVSVLLGNGTGGFGAKTDFTVGSHPQSVVILDVSGDGKADLTATGGNINAVSVLLGDGTGNFAAKSDFATGANPVAVAVGDLNRDGREDLMVANYNSSTISMLLGNSTGVFAVADSFAVGSHPNGVAIGDLNGDGLPDLVTTNANPGLSILFGDAAGGFGQSTSLACPSARYVALADLNQDGRLDIAAANRANPGSVSILINSGSGSFLPANIFTTGTNTNSLAIGDLNADGKLDIVATNQASSNLSILMGNGAGGVSSVTTLATATSPLNVLISDINGDGLPDLAVGYAQSTAPGPPNPVCVHFGTGAGQFSGRTDLANNGYCEGVGFRDMNSDGVSDLIVFSEDVYAGLSVHIGNGSGGFAPMIDTYVYAIPSSMVIADFNVDGRQDVATDDPGASSNPYCLPAIVSLGNGGGGFGPYFCPPVSSPTYGVATQDLDLDGRPDLVYANGTGNMGFLSVLRGLRPTRTSLSSRLMRTGFAFTAAISVPSPGYGTPTGSVRFFDGTTLLGSAPVLLGRASLNVNPAPGDRAYSAVYAGDARFFPSISATTDWRVTVPQHPAVIAPPSDDGTVAGSPIADFALESPRPNPIRGHSLTIGFSLPSAEPARLDLLDISGRHLAGIDVGSPGPGHHSANLGSGRMLAPGIYLVRLTQGGRSRSMRVAVLM